MDQICRCAEKQWFRHKAGLADYWCNRDISTVTHSLARSKGQTRCSLQDCFRAAGHARIIIVGGKFQSGDNVLLDLAEVFHQHDAGLLDFVLNIQNGPAIGRYRQSEPGWLR